MRRSSPAHAATLERQRFDTAVVAWDLVPAWNPRAACCRWNETVDLYRLLALSDALPLPWRQEVRARHRDLIGRARPAARTTNPGLRAYMVLALCMEPMFEALLVQDEQSVRRALDLVGQQSPRGWPGGGWGPTTQRPDRDVLVPAIKSLCSSRPRPDVARRVRGDFWTNKDGWGEYLLRKLLDHDGGAAVRSHPIWRRMTEWLA